jgi:hypothetical protein
LITETFDRRAVRISIALLVGIPVTLIVLPLAGVSLVTGLAVAGSPEKVMFVAMVFGPIFGLLGIIGAWLRLVTTEPELRQNVSRRTLILWLLAAGIAASLLVSVFFWTYPDTQALIVVFGAVATLGAFLMRVSLP